MLLGFLPGHAGIAGAVEIAVMEFYIMESQVIAQRVYVHFAYALGIITCFRQFSRKGVFVLPGDPVLIAGPAVMLLGHACMQRGTGGNAAGTGAVSPVKRNASACQRIQIRRFYIRMAGESHTVSPHLVGHDKENIGLLHKFPPSY